MKLNQTCRAILKIVVIFFLFLFTLYSLSIAQEQVRKCWLRTIVGDVKVQRAKSTRWVDARPNMPLRPNDAIRTFVESKVVIETSEGSVIELNENVTLELSAFYQSQNGAQKTSVTILTGEIIANVKKLVHTKSKFEFETPTAVAAIRGTKVGFNVNNNKTDIRVYEGMVYVTPKGSKKGAELQSNQMTSVEKGQKTLVVKKFEAGTEGSGGKEIPDSVISVPDTLQGENVPPDSVETHSDTLDSAQTTGSDSSEQTLSEDTTESLANDTVSSFETDTTQPSSKDSLLSPVDDSLGDSEAESDDEQNSFSIPVDSLQSQTGARLSLLVISPENDISVMPGSPLIISGTVSPADAVVTVDGALLKVSANGQFSTSFISPAQTGQHSISIEAVSNNESKSITRTIVVKELQKELTLTLNSPQNGAIVSKPLIRISGTVTPGASVSVSGMPINVSSNGTFFRDIPIPNEEGEIILEIEATLGQATVSESRSVIFQVPEEEISIELTTPVDNETVCEPMVFVTASIQPAHAEVFVNGKASPLRSGLLRELVVLSNQQGEQEIEIEVVTKSKSKRMVRKIVYNPVDRKCNTAPPMLQPAALPFSSQTGKVLFTVYDKTPFDEITFHTTTDGVHDFETGAPGSRFYLALEEGMHSYTVYAEDLNGNRSATISGAVAYFIKEAAIRIKEPSTPYSVLYIPPSSPNSTFRPRYTIAFSVENIPDDNTSALLKEIKIINTATSESKFLKQFSNETDFEFDMLLVRGINTIVIEVRDINERVFTNSCSIDVK